MAHQAGILGVTPSLGARLVQTVLRRRYEATNEEIASVDRYEFLHRLHERYQPRTYFEIGVNDGRSLALSSVPSVAVDPAHKITSGLHCDLHLVKSTSDEFFARDRPLEHFGEARVDLAFIDGMHLLEFALRDFINTERWADWSSIIVLDDQLPRNVDESARHRHTTAWTGDVFKMIPVLQRYRPDLRLVVIDSEPTGVVCVFGADPTGTALADHYDQIIRDFLVADPQQIPDALLTRSCAIEPSALLDASLWASLRAGRDAADGRYGRDELFADLDALMGDAGPRLGDWLPDPSAGRVPEAVPDAAGEAEIVARLRAEKAAAKRGSSAANTRPVRTRQVRRDVFSRAARALPLLRKVPGARTVARLFR